MDLVEFTDPRLVAIYDTLNPYQPDTQPRFYRELAAELGAASIVDLGCGTGLITCDLAARGYALIGIEPAPGMLAHARRRCGGVRWIDGDVDHLAALDADLAIMTGHVAQFFLTDEDWLAALTALRDVLRPGGHLAFESRNPEAREWERWTPAARRSVDDPTAGRIDAWSEVRDVRDRIVEYTIHYLFVATGDELVAPSRLRFRTEAELTESLVAVGFAVEQLYGDWGRGPVTAQHPELIVVARAR